MKRVKENEEPLSGVNIIPVIGVTLVLLVILMVMSPIMNIPGLPVDLPEAVSRETKDQNVTVSMAADGTISVDHEIIEWPELPKTLRATLKKRSEEDLVVIVRADRDLPYGAVEKLIRVVNRHAGRNAVAVATRQRNNALETVIER
jgi:biopolymer transport protein ExbD